MNKSGWIIQQNQSTIRGILNRVRSLDVVLVWVDEEVWERFCFMVGFYGFVRFGFMGFSGLCGLLGFGVCVWKGTV